MTKPLIGLTPMFDERKSRYILPGEYAEAVIKSGGVPLILPVCRSIKDAEAALRAVSGVFFVGGEDISPALYGEETSEKCGVINATRDESESLIFAVARRRSLPVLGVCRGMQLINALLGGTLHQDIAQDEISHMQPPPYDEFCHAVRPLPGTPLCELAGEGEFSVNSYHHQAVKELAPGLKCMALAPDGLAEAAFSPESRFLWLIQWHPETLFEKDGLSREIFCRFISAAAQYETENMK